MDVHDERRAAANEARFREMNERRLREGSEFHGSTGGSLPVMCECARDACTVEFEVTADLYVRAHEDPRRFVVRTGHELPEIERVVEDLGEDRLLIEKFGEGAEVVEGAE